jgi:hypothetical protein
LVVVAQEQRLTVKAATGIILFFLPSLLPEGAGLVATLLLLLSEMEEMVGLVVEGEQGLEHMVEQADRATLHLFPRVKETMVVVALIIHHLLPLAVVEERLPLVVMHQQVQPLEFLVMVALELRQPFLAPQQLMLVVGVVRLVPDSRMELEAQEAGVAEFLAAQQMLALRIQAVVGEGTLMSHHPQQEQAAQALSLSNTQSLPQRL